MKYNYFTRLRYCRCCGFTFCELMYYFVNYNEIIVKCSWKFKKFNNNMKNQFFFLLLLVKYYIKWENILFIQCEFYLRN